MLEDKLRELRLLALDPREYDDRTVTLSQLDSLRRELIGAAKNNLKYVVFGKVGHRWASSKMGTRCFPLSMAPCQWACCIPAKGI